MRVNLSADLEAMAGDLLLVIGVPLLVVLGLTYLNRNSKELLAARYGAQAIVYVGGLGVVVHELSHLLMAILFGHHINDFKLLMVNVRANNGALGYVNHSWNQQSRYQSLGNVLIGTAPIYGCTAILILLTRWLVPGIYHWGLQNASSWLGIPINSPVSGSVHWLPFFIWAVLSVSITIGGFDLSNADLKNAGPAFIALYLIVALILAGLILLGFAAQVQNILRVVLTWFVLAMLISLVWSVIVNVLCRLSNLAR